MVFDAITNDIICTPGVGGSDFITYEKTVEFWYNSRGGGGGVAYCIAADIVLSGGTGINAQETHVILSTPYNDDHVADNPNAWRVHLLNESYDEGILSIAMLCLDKTP